MILLYWCNMRDKKVFSLVSLITALIILVLSFSVLISSVAKNSGKLNFLIFFTYQSVLLVGLAAMFHMFNYDGVNKKFFKVLAEVALFDIIVTCLVYNIILVGELREAGITPSFIDIIAHLVIPILYLLFYIVFVEDHLKLKQFYFLMIHPLLYGLVSLILNWTNTVIMNGKTYVYSFFDVSSDSRNYFRLLELLVLGVILSLGIVYAKIAEEKRINAVNNK